MRGARWNDYAYRGRRMPSPRYARRWRFVAFGSAAACVSLIAIWLSSIRFFVTYSNAADFEFSLHHGRIRFIIRPGESVRGAGTPLGWKLIDTRYGELWRSMSRRDRLRMAGLRLPTWEHVDIAAQTVPIARERGFVVYDYGTFPMRTVMDLYQSEIPLWMPTLSAALLAAVAWRRCHVAHRRRKRNQCVSCGYDLTGNVSGRCPECGGTVPDGTPESSANPSLRAGPGCDFADMRPAAPIVRKE